MTTIQSLHISSKPLTEFAYQAATRVHHIKPANKTHTCSLHQEDCELPALKSMKCSWSLLYSSYCCFFNFWNSLLVFSIFLFSWSTSYSWSTLSTDVSVLEEFIRALAFFKKNCVAAGLGEDLENNISTRHWFLAISNRFYSYSFHIFLPKSRSKH